MEWIECKNKLPEDEKSVIIFIKKKNSDFSTVAIGYLSDSTYLDEEEEQQWFSFEDYFDMEDVSHWMPLPKPPKD